MSIKIYGKGNKIITTLKEWQQYAPPKKPTQWQDNKSAKEFARLFEPNFNEIPKFIRDAIDNNIAWNGYAEYETKLDNFNGEGRNHDLLLVPQLITNNSIVIGIEAKVNEPFGADYYLDREIIEAVKTKIIIPNSNKLQRIINLIKYTFGNSKFDYTKMKYQLLTALVGTIIEAKRYNCNKCILLIVELVNQKPNNKNLNDWNYFVECIQKAHPDNCIDNIAFSLEKIHTPGSNLGI